jgi:hypothetical protein
MGLPNKPTKSVSDNTLGISYNLSNPTNMIAKANANVYSVMPKINPDNYHNSVGVIESGNVSMDLMKPTTAERKKKRKNSKVKRKKSKNTRKTKDKE